MSSISGSINMGRERLQQTNKNTYIGQNAQQNPLADLASRLFDNLSQSQAQQNLTFGGPGYSGSFVPQWQREATNPYADTSKLNANDPNSWSQYGDWQMYPGFGTRPQGPRQQMVLTEPITVDPNRQVAATKYAVRPAGGWSGEAGIPTGFDEEGKPIYARRWGEEIPPVPDPPATPATSADLGDTTQPAASGDVGGALQRLQQAISSGKSNPMGSQSFSRAAFTPDGGPVDPPTPPVPPTTPPPADWYPPPSQGDTLPATGGGKGTRRSPAGPNRRRQADGAGQITPPWNVSPTIDPSPYGRNFSPFGGNTDFATILDQGSGMYVPISRFGLALDPDGRVVQNGSTYRPYNTRRMPTADDAAAGDQNIPSPIQRQGGTNDLYSTFVPWRQEAPTGGLYGQIQEQAKGATNPYELDMADRYDQMSYDPRTAETTAASSIYQQQGFGGPTGTESGNLSGWQGLSNGSFTPENNAASAIYQQQGFGGPTGSETWNAQQWDEYGAGLNDNQGTSAAGYRSMLQNNVPEADLMRQEGMLAARAGFDTARADMARHVAGSGNTAGYYGAAGKLGAEQAIALADQARRNELAIGALGQQRKEVGLQGLTGAGNQQASQRAGALSAANQWNQSQRGYQALGAQGLAGLGQARTAQTVSGLQGENQWTQQQRGVQSQGAAGLLNVNQAQNQRQQAGLTGMGQYAQLNRGVQQQAIGAGQNLYNQQQQEKLSTFQQLADVLRTPQETYTMLGKTTGNGGVGVNT